MWDVYDAIRTARLNAKYYGCRVSALERENFWIELTLAATATGSAIAGFAFWSTTAGKPIWQGLMIVSAILAIVKPLLKLTDRIQKLEQLIGVYRNIEYELKAIEIGIKQRRTFDSELQSQFAEALKQMKEAAANPAGGFRTDDRLRKRCQEEVAYELPSDHFFVPEH